MAATKTSQSRYSLHVSVDGEPEKILAVALDAKQLRYIANELVRKDGPLKRKRAEIRESLFPRWREVLSLRESGLTFREIGELCGIGDSNARELYVKASRYRRTDQDFQCWLGISTNS